MIIIIAIITIIAVAIIIIVIIQSSRCWPPTHLGISMTTWKVESEALYGMSWNGEIGPEASFRKHLYEPVPLCPLSSAVYSCTGILELQPR